jgi:hypothetical protein
MTVRLSGLRAGCAILPRNLPIFIPVTGWVNSGAMVRLEGLDALYLTSLHLICHFPKITWFTGERPWGICRQFVPELYDPNKKNFLAWARKRTISTERPPFVGEWVPRGQRDESLRPYSRLSRPEPLLLFPSSFSVSLTGLSGTCSRPTTFFVVPGIELGTSGSVARNSDH